LHSLELQVCLSAEQMSKRDELDELEMYLYTPHPQHTRWVPTQQISKALDAPVRVTGCVRSVANNYVASFVRHSRYGDRTLGCVWSTPTGRVRSLKKLSRLTRPDSLAFRVQSQPSSIRSKPNTEPYLLQCIVESGPPLRQRPVAIKP